MDHTVQNRLRKCPFTNPVMPFNVGELGAEDRGPRLVPVLDNLKDVPCRMLVERCQQPFVKGQEVDFLVLTYNLLEHPFASGDGEFVEKVWKPDVLYRVVVPAGGDSEGTAQVGFPVPGCPP